jgi:uncharacterized protein (DUF2147 family)
MRKTHVLLLALLIVAASCSGEPARKILGTWKEMTGNEQLSFYPDGNVVLTNRAASIAGTYQVTREGSLKLNLQFLQFFRVSETRRVKFKGDTMILIDEKGKAEEYRRSRASDR